MESEATISARHNRGIISHNEINRKSHDTSESEGLQTVTAVRNPTQLHNKQTLINSRSGVSSQYTLKGSISALLVPQGILPATGDNSSMYHDSSAQTVHNSKT